MDERASGSGMCRASEIERPSRPSESAMLIKRTRSSLGKGELE